MLRPDEGWTLFFKNVPPSNRTHEGAYLTLFTGLVNHAFGKNCGSEVFIVLIGDFYMLFCCIKQYYVKKQTVCSILF